MTDFATSARPTRAAIAWATADSIFVEIPCGDLPPYITRYHKTAAGLQAALNILLENPETETRTIARSHPKLRKVGPTFDESERQAARDALKKAGII